MTAFSAASLFYGIMARSKTSAKSPLKEGMAPETREQKRRRIARQKEKMAEHKKLIPKIVVRGGG